MNYEELKTLIKEEIEDDFTDTQLAMFVKQAEQLIFSSIQPPVLRANVRSNLTTGNRFVTLPTDYLNTHSFAVELADGKLEFLLHKDSNFIREAYPDDAVTGLPKHYAQYDEDTLIVGPTPDSNYAIQLHYARYPESIVTAGTSWLGNKYDSALLNASLVEAARFIKSDQQLLDMYRTMRDTSLQLLKNLSDGKLRQDSYRSGQVRTKVI